MCYSCYEKYGKPSIVNHTTKRTAELVRVIYEFSDVGGNAHIVLDDFNIEDHHVEGCLNDVRIKEASGETGQLQAERKCLEAFQAMTLDERASALAIYEGWI